MTKKKNPKSCPRGKKLVKIKGRAARSFCASTSKKGGKRRGKKSGIAGKSVAARKTMMKKVCAKLSGAKKKRMAGLCRWARS